MHCVSEKLSYHIWYMGVMCTHRARQLIIIEYISLTLYSSGSAFTARKQRSVHLMLMGSHTHYVHHKIMDNCDFYTSAIMLEKVTKICQ